MKEKINHFCNTQCIFFDCLRTITKKTEILLSDTVVIFLHYIIILFIFYYSLFLIFRKIFVAFTFILTHLSLFLCVITPSYIVRDHIFVSRFFFFKKILIPFTRLFSKPFFVFFDNSQLAIFINMKKIVKTMLYHYVSYMSYVSYLSYVSYMS